MEHHMQKNSNFDMIFSEIVCIKGESKQCSSYSKHATTSAGPVASCPRKSPPLPAPRDLINHTECIIPQQNAQPWN